MKRGNQDALTLGFALFAMFFGAGNLIFPPALGLEAGESWLLCGLGFFVTAIGMPLLGIIAIAKTGGKLTDIGDKVNPVFSKIFSTVIILALGPLLAIPRTGATTFEIGFNPIFPSISPVIVSVIFFGLTLYLVINPSDIIDKIAKVLTPMLIGTIFLIIYKGIVSPIGSPVDVMKENPLAIGFVKGYQTMDALAALLFGGIVLKSIIAKGYNDTKEQINITAKAGLIAALGLTLVYGGLTYLGASGGELFDLDISRAGLLMGITDALLGDLGKIALGVAVSIACLTTSVGLTATVGNYFNELSNNKVSYNLIVTITVIFSGIFANVGVEKIVAIAIPLLVIVYPVAIVLILMAILDDYISDNAYVGAVLGAFTISLTEGLMAMNIDISFMKSIINSIPLADVGFAWVLPSIIGGLITIILLENKVTTSAQCKA